MYHIFLIILLTKLFYKLKLKQYIYKFKFITKNIINIKKIKAKKNLIKLKK